MTNHLEVIGRGKIYLFLAWISIMLQVIYLGNYKSYIFMALTIVLLIFAGVNGGYDD